MANNYFQFKQFTIHQQYSAMKVGTDGVLLGAWAHCEKASKILDIGTGTGLVALMLAQRSKAMIDAIEIDKTACQEAMKNIVQSPWPEKIQVHHSSFQEFAQTTSQTYDLIVSNPPFFQQSLKAATSERTHARHDDALPVADLFAGAKKLLATHGIFTVIIPIDILNNYKQEACINGLYLDELLWVKPTPAKAPKRVLCAFSKSELPLKEETLIVESGGRHVYSDAYKRLTRDFYLGF